MSEPNEYPKTFNQCPNCGSTSRVVGDMVQDMKEEGKVTEHFDAWVMVQNSGIEPDKPHFTMPVVTWMADICYDCGTLYCVQVNVRNVMMQGGQPPTSGLSLN